MIDCLDKGSMDQKKTSHTYTESHSFVDFIPISKSAFWNQLTNQPWVCLMERLVMEKSWNHLIRLIVAPLHVSSSLCPCYFSDAFASSKYISINNTVHSRGEMHAYETKRPIPNFFGTNTCTVTAIFVTVLACCYQKMWRQIFDRSRFQILTISSLCIQAEEGQRGIRAHVRGGSHRHQELSSHQRSAVGAGG